MGRGVGGGLGVGGCIGVVGGWEEVGGCGGCGVCGVGEEGQFVVAYAAVEEEVVDVVVLEG